MPAGCCAARPGSPSSGPTTACAASSGSSARSRAPRCPHPAPVALCDDHAVLGCTFYLMACVDGINPLPVPEWLDDPAGHVELTFALTDALARMHDVDPVAAGIADLGRPDDFHERQVSRWTRQLESYEGRELPGLDRVTTWLDANRPALVRAVDHARRLPHDERDDRPRPPARVVAIVDWETATIGDPLLDLAGFYEIWTSPPARAGPPATRSRPATPRPAASPTWETSPTTPCSTTSASRCCSRASTSGR